jgi:GntR family transcriptional regulator
MTGSSEEWREPGASSVNRIPKYYRLKQELREEISQLDPGAAIATERVLSSRFAVSRTTVRQALQELAIEGLLQRFQGRGTFVAPAKLTQTLQLTSYTEDTAATGRRPTSRLLDVAVVPASVDVAAELDLSTNAKVQRVERLRLADEEPMAVEAVYLDAERFGAIGDAIDRGTSLYAVLEEKYGVTLAHATETIEAVLASPAEASLLETGSGLPLLLLTRTSWDQQGRPVEYVRSLYRGDRYRFVANLSRPDASSDAERSGVGRRPASAV